MSSVMKQEIAAIPDLLRKQQDEVASAVEGLVGALSRRSMQRASPTYYSMGWGSSACLCDWFAYVAASCCSWSIVPWNMSLSEKAASVLLDSASCLLAFSQSGVSTDLCRVMEIAHKNHALCVSVLNQLESPLAELSNLVLPVCAGEERSVVATKSFILSATAVLYFIAELNDDAELQNALKHLPSQLEEQSEFPLYVDAMSDVEHMLVLGNGFQESIASETALKLKESCQIHAEGMSYAAMMHGPIALLAKPIPVLALLQEEMTAVTPYIDKIMACGASPICIAPVGLNVPDSMTLVAHAMSSTHPACHSLLMLHQVYRFVEACSVARGLNPDKPMYLSKETSTE